MPSDIASLILTLTLCMLTMAVALPAVMGQVGAAARRAQCGVACQAAGWVLLILSGQVDAGSLTDRLLSTLSMAGIASGMALNAGAFDLWCGRAAPGRAPALIAVVLTAGYAVGFSSYSFRVGWANGLLALQMALVAATLWRRPLVPVGRWRWLLVLALAAQITVTAWRGALGAFAPASFPAFMAPHPVNVAFALVANVTTVLWLIGILLAHRDEAARALERLATLDGLTGVLNRRAWLLQAGSEMALSVRHDTPLALLLIDLDYFKQINDSRGHDFAATLQAACRNGDFICCYGGEEFCILMSHTGADAAIAFDGRLRSSLRDAAAPVLGHALDYSAGMSTRAPGADTLDAMLRRADTALYQAKAQGRSRTLRAAQAAMAA